MIDFLKYRWLSFAFSALMVVAGIGGYFYKVQKKGSAFSYGIEFTGGTQVYLKFSKPVSALQLKDIVEQAGWPGAGIREFSGQEGELLVRVKEFSSDAKGVAQRVQAAVQEGVGSDNQVTILQSESIGSSVEKEQRQKSLWAVFLVFIALLIYIAVRFWFSLGASAFSFAVGAVVALIHDALAMLLVIMFLDIEITQNVMVALLAVLGYSINDTIVIFAQIKNSLQKMRGVPLYDVVNSSLNYTFRRTILTSFSTALVVGALYVLGGETLHDMALTLLVGVIFGTYSSIYIASPVMMMLYKGERN